MQSRRMAIALAAGVTAAAVAAPAGAGAASCIGQVASAPTEYPTEKADFVTSFAGPGFGDFVSGYAQVDPAACPPLPVPGG